MAIRMADNKPKTNAYHKVRVLAPRKKTEYQSSIVSINMPENVHHGKAGLVIDDCFLHAGKNYCRVILGKEVLLFEHEYLKILVI